MSLGSLSIGVGIIFTTNELKTEQETSNQMHPGLIKTNMKKCAAGQIFCKTKCAAGKIYQTKCATGQSF